MVYINYMSLKSDIKRIEAVIGQSNFSKVIGLSGRALQYYKTGKRKPSKQIQSSITELKTQLKYKHRTNNLKKQKQKTDKIRKEFIQIPKTKKYYKIKTKHFIFKNIELNNLEIYKKRLINYKCESGYMVLHVKAKSLKTEKIIEKKMATEITMIVDISENIIDRQINELRSRVGTDIIILITRFDFIGVKEC